MLMGFAFVSLATVWLIGHLVAKRRFAALKTNLPATYRSEITVPTDGAKSPPLVALCVDLMRKENRAVPLDALTDKEKTMVVHAQAIDDLPQWMSQYATMWLSPANRILISQLRQIKTSRPTPPKQHFGAIQRQLQLRSPSES